MSQLEKGNRQDLFMSKLPTKKQILDWIRENPKKSNKREISKAFEIKGAMRIELKRILKELAQEGKIEKKKKSFEDPNQLSPVSICLLYTSPSPRDRQKSRMPSSA